MKRFNTGFSRAFKSSGVTLSTPDETQEALSKYGRVIDVILDSSHPMYNTLGGTQALYGVFFQYLFTRDTIDEENKSKLVDRFAYCGGSNLRRMPVKGEIVRLETQAAVVNSEADFNSNSYTEKLYWTEIVPAWNSTHHNAYPDTVATQKADFGPDFKENGDIKPLQLCAGDITLEGRHGQSIRFGGTKSSLSPIAKDDVNGKPYTIIRNGQASSNSDTVFENVNKDDSSIYLTSDHKVPLQEANRTFKGVKGKVPAIASDYQGKQIVVNSDRIVINSREENLVLAAKNHASINAKSVSIDGEDYVGVDGKKIYLGTYAQTEQEPVLKGQVSVQFLKDLYNILHNFFTSQGSALGSSGTTAWEKASAVSFNMTAKSLEFLFSGIDRLKSQKVYTE